MIVHVLILHITVNKQESCQRNNTISFSDSFIIIQTVLLSDSYNSNNNNNDLINIVA